MRALQQARCWLHIKISVFFRITEMSTSETIEEEEELDEETITELPATTEFPRRGQRWYQMNRNLISIKLLMLLLYGGMTALYPFLTVHMRSIGLTVTDTAIIYAILPFVSCLGPPLFGSLADKIGNYKTVLIVVNLVSIGTHLLLWFAVPDVVPNVIHYQKVTSGASLTLYCVNGNPALSNVSYREMADDERCSLKSTEDHSGLFHCRVKNDTIVARTVTLDNIDTLSFRHGFPENSTLSQYCKIPNLPEISCETYSKSALLCNKTELPFRARALTFFLYLIIRLVATVCINTVFAILDAVAYQVSAEQAGDLGFQRMFALIGICIFPIISGWLVGVVSDESGFPDYSPAFYIHCASHSLAMIISFFMNISVREKAENIWKNVGKILQNPRICGFIFMVFYAGCAWGFLENYLFLFMEDIGSPKWLLGMTNTVSALSAIPVIAASTIIVKHMGHTSLIILCVMLYGCRFTAYSFIMNPFMVLPVEVLEAFTTSLLWVVISVYCGKIAPAYLATIQGISASAHNALGRGVGSLVGGILFEQFGARTTYRVFGGTSLAVGFAYTVLFYSCLRRLSYIKPDEVQSGDSDPIGDVINPDESEYLRQLAKMDAFSRRYSLGVPRVTARNSVDLRWSPRISRTTDNRSSRRKGSKSTDRKKRQRAESVLSKEEESDLQKFARIDAFTRRYSMGMVVMGNSRRGSTAEPRPQADPQLPRRSSLRVTIVY